MGPFGTNAQLRILLTVAQSFQAKKKRRKSLVNFTVLQIGEVIFFLQHLLEKLGTQEIERYAITDFQKGIS